MKVDPTQTKKKKWKHNSMSTNKKELNYQGPKYIFIPSMYVMLGQNGLMFCMASIPIPNLLDIKIMGHLG